MRLKAFILAILLLIPHTAFAEGNDYPNTYINTGNYIEDLVGVAEGQVGYSEKYSSTGSDIKPNQDGGYTKYGAAYNNPFAPWCTYFILWCAREAGIPNSVICASGACGNPDIMVNWFKNTDSWRGNEYVPKRGDIVFFDVNSDNGADHAGIVRGVSDDAETIYTIEGNCGGYYGYTTAREVRKNNIMGYGIPQYHLSERLNGRVAIDSAAYLHKLIPDFNTLLWSGTELEILCSDGDHYLAYVPYYYSGGFRIFYIRKSSAMVTGGVKDASEVYNISKTGVLISDATLYCRPTTEELRSGTSDATVREKLESGKRFEVLFEENGFYFVRNNRTCGFVDKMKISLDN